MKDVEAKGISVLKQLKSFEQGQEARLKDAEKKAEKGMADAISQNEIRLQKEKEVLEKRRQAEIANAKELGLEEAKGIIKEYKKSTENLKRVYSRNFEKTVKAVVSEMLGGEK